MKKFLKPSKGLLVRNHQNKLRPLSDDGELVDFDPTWARRLRDGDVTESTPEKAESKAVPKQPVTLKKEG